MSNYADTPFGQIKRIDKEDRPPTEEELKSYVGYVTEMNYSNYSGTAGIAGLATMLRVPNKIHELFFRSIIAKGQKRKFFWPKAEQQAKEKRAAFVKDRLNLNSSKSFEIEELIPNEVLDKLINIYENKQKLEVIK